jgi:protein involved in polysaccharide export with SLBB domain
MTVAGAAAALAISWAVLAAPGADGPAKADPSKIKAGDRLSIKASSTLPDQPINGLYLVEPSGKVALGPVYGRIAIAGLTLEDAEAHVRDQLARLIKEPQVSITLYDPVIHGGGEACLSDRVSKLEKEVRELRDTVDRLRR